MGLLSNSTASATPVANSAESAPTEAVADKVPPVPPCVLIAGDDAFEVQQIVEHLRHHLEHVEGATGGDAVSEFRQHSPTVLVLAFKELEHAERYYAALQRHVHSEEERLPKVVLLCGKDDTAAAFDLCKQRYIDDYVLYWPNPQDGLHLPLSVWRASQEPRSAHDSSVASLDLHRHAQQLEDLDQALAAGFEQGEQQVSAAHESLSKLERALAADHDDFSHRLVQSEANGIIQIRDAPALAKEFAQFKDQTLAKARLVREEGLASISSWARGLKDTVAPTLRETRQLAAKIRPRRPVLLVVDDDEIMRSLLRSVLDSLQYQVVVVSSGQEALRELVHLRPDAILMDIRLTDTDGVTLTRQLKGSAELRHIPVLLMSGDSRRETLVNGMAAGAVDFITKPFRLQVIRSKLEKALRRGPSA